jgi:YCII-related domain
MPRFIYLYRGPAQVSDPSERMAAFSAWLERIGPGLVEVGSPFGASTSIRDDGIEEAAGELVGYTIVEAADLAGAKAFTEGLPFLSGRDGKRAVEIFELLPL